MLLRVAFDLGCPADRIVVTPLGDDTWGVSGCGKKAAYINVPRVGYVNNLGVQRDGPAPPRPVAQVPPQVPSAEDFVVVPLRAYLLRAHGDVGAAFATEVPAIVEQLDHIFEPAGVYFSLSGTTQTIELIGDLPRQRAELAASVPKAPEGEGLRVFFVRDLDANGAGLGGGDMVVRERPGLLRADGEGGNPVARVVGHVIGGALGLTATRDASQLMAMGTTGIGLDPTSARSARAAAKQIHGAKTFGEAVSAGVFPDAVAAIRARTAPSLRAQ
jgi:hypothetical protein